MPPFRPIRQTTRGPTSYRQRTPNVEAGTTIASARTNNPNGVRAGRPRAGGSTLIGGIQHLSEPLPLTKCLVTFLHAVPQEPVHVVSELQEPCLHDHSTQRHPPAKTHRQHGAKKDCSVTGFLVNPTARPMSLWLLAGPCS